MVDGLTCERLATLKESEKSMVYLVLDTETKTMMVEKHLKGEQAVYARLRDLYHPYLPQIYDVQFGDGMTIVHEEYILGETLESVQVNERQLTHWLLELSDVVGFLHNNGILHRDIKPSNLLIGEDGHIRLIDFDAAREGKDGADSDTRLLGTRGYAPPEQYGFSQTDGRADIYAMGVTFRGLLGPTARKRRWKRILRRCTALDPKDRFRTASQIKRAVYTGRFWRWFIRPALSLWLAYCLLFAILAINLFARDPDARMFLGFVATNFFSKRASVFEYADIPALEKSEVTLEPFSGDEAESYRQMIAAQPGLIFISTGYADEEGNLLLGEISTSYDFRIGQMYYLTFRGLYTISEDRTVRYIPADKCAPYAPAVMCLYHLDCWTTPLF